MTCSAAPCPCSRPEPHIHVYKYDSHGMLRCTLCQAIFGEDFPRGTDGR